MRQRGRYPSYCPHFFSKLKPHESQHEGDVFELNFSMTDTASRIIVEFDHGA